MAQRVPPVLPIPAAYADALAACMAAKPLQHQDELTALLTFIDQLQPALSLRVIVEIGSFRGGTMELWARLASDLVVSIDMAVPAEFYGNIGDADMAARNARFTAQFPHVHGIVGNSHSLDTERALRDQLNGQPIDLLFIDGDHTYEGVQADYEMYSRYVRPGGVIAFHDVICDPVRSLPLEIAVRPYFDTLPPPRFIFHAGSHWGGIGAVIAA